MSIDKFAGIFTIRCDICGEESPEMFDDFYDAVDYKKRNGWRSQRDATGNWEDVCPDCQNDDWED